MFNLATALYGWESGFSRSSLMICSDRYVMGPRTACWAASTLGFRSRSLIYEVESVNLRTAFRA